MISNKDLFNNKLPIDCPRIFVLLIVDGMYSNFKFSIDRIAQKQMDLVLVVVVVVVVVICVNILNINMLIEKKKSFYM
jgi:hypothetical protein